MKFLFDTQAGQTSAAGSDEKEPKSIVANPEGDKPGEEQPVKTPEELILEEQAKAESEKKKQTDEENARFARERRERERQEEIAKAKEEARVSAIIESIGVNPYTNDEIKDADDVDQYLLMKRIEKDGGDPIVDFPKYQKRYQREKLEQQQRDKAQKEQVSKDVESFTTAHPDVKIDALFKDEDFMIFSKGKLGVIPLTEIYADYQQFSQKYRKMTEEEKVKAQEEAQRKAAEALARKQATPGSLQSSAQTDGDYFTDEQINKMTQKEVMDNLEKVNRSIEYNKRKR